jgi:glycosyltransferase involved in cell wall biosynthesis
VLDRQITGTTAQPVSKPSERVGDEIAKEAPLISVVVPVYNESKNIDPFLKRTVPVLQRLGTYEIIFALDPSTDGTEQIISAESALNPRIGLIVLSRRFGQPAATMAGILNCRGQWCVVIDVDLQDPPEVIEAMWQKSKEGFDVVTARRASRKGETVVKRIVAHLGYRAINSLAEVPIPADTGDFRLISRRVVEELRGLNETHGFLKGLVPLVGFPQGEVLYDRDARAGGVSKYNRFIGTVRYQINGIFCFSTMPLRMMMWVGFGIALLSALGIIVMLVLKFIHGNDYPMGIPTITILVLFIGGVQLTAVGVLGEYIARIYDEVRRRPMYIVQRAINVTLRDPRGPHSGQQSAPVDSHPA